MLSRSLTGPEFRGGRMTMGRTLQTPRAAAIAGVVFSLLLASAIVLLQLVAMSDPTRGLAFLTDRRFSLTVRLVPFAGIAFLWLMGVVRDLIGEYEDRFFATVFLGSGLLFVALLFVATSVASAGVADVAARPGVMPEDWGFGRGLAAVLMHTYAMRMGAVFAISTATIGLRTGRIPRWLGFSGYAISVVLLLGIGFSKWVELLFPFWILLLSLHMLAASFRKVRALA